MLIILNYTCDITISFYLDGPNRLCAYRSHQQSGPYLRGNKIRLVRILVCMEGIKYVH